METPRDLQSTKPAGEHTTTPVDVTGILRELNILPPNSAEAGTAPTPSADEFLARLRDTATCQACVTRLFPDGIPTDPTFFERLDDVRRQFDFAPNSEEALGLLWSEAMRRLSADGRQELLTAFVRQPAHDVFEPLASLWVILRDHAFRASFLTEWFVGLVRVVEGDFLQDGAWTAIRTHCTHHVDTALEILRLLPTPPDNTRLNIAGFILGVLRTSVVAGPQSSAFQEVETFFRDQADARLRSVFHWSWTRTARDRTLTTEEFNAVFARASRGPEDRDTVISVACQLLAARIVTDGSAQRCRKWIGAQISPAISPEAKYAVVRAAHHIVFPPAGSGDAAPDLSDWIVSILPVPQENLGTWRTISAYLCDLLKKDRARFTALFEHLAATGASTLHSLMHDRHLSRLHGDMHGAGLGDLVGRMCVSPDMDTRRLGLYLFDSLEIPQFPATVLASGIASRLLFYELQRVLQSPKAIARILVAVASFAEGATDGFREAVFDELKLQAHNFAGECRTELGALGRTIPLVTQALEEVATYFTALDRAHKAGINAMEVAGYRRAAINQRRRFSREVAKNAEAHSTILQFVKKTRLLYGKWSSVFLGGQVLGDPIPLASSEFSMELPLVDYCDPEEMAMRRLHASRVIERLLESCEDDKPSQELTHE